MALRRLKLLLLIPAAGILFLTYHAHFLNEDHGKVANNLVRAFLEKVLEEDPDFAAARHNLALL